MSAPLSVHHSGWAQYNELLENALAPLDAEQLSLRAAPGLWPIRTIANHIVAARAWWFNSWMGEGGPTLADLVDFDENEGSETRGASEIVDALGRSWSCLAECLGRWTEADLDATFQPFPHRPAETRQFIVWHVAEHDLHHGGEISLTLGMHGLAGLDL
ncbi:MAG TPA: DinB family protein [Terriglobales bacterium]|nr:DinB family protein [Terriglobales bacterium]